VQNPSLAVLVADFLSDDQSLPAVISGFAELTEIAEGVAEAAVREAFAPLVAVLPGDRECAARTVECIVEPGKTAVRVGEACQGDVLTGVLACPLLDFLGNDQGSQIMVRRVLETLYCMVGVADVCLRVAFSPRVAGLLRDSERRPELL